MTLYVPRRTNKKLIFHIPHKTLFANIYLNKVFKTVKYDVLVFNYFYTGF